MSRPPPHSVSKQFTLDASDDSDGVGASLGSIALVPRSATRPNSGIFDVFAGVHNDVDAGPDSPLAVPKDTLVFDLARDGDSQLEEAESNAVVQDVCKKELDDLSTPQLVAPCAAPRASWFDVCLDDSDFTAFRFNEFGDIAEKTSCAGHANFNSQDHLPPEFVLGAGTINNAPKQDFLAHAKVTLLDVYDSDAGSECSLTDVEFGDGLQTLQAQCGPLPQSQCGPLPQHMPQTPCASHDADLADEQTLRTQCGPLPQQHMPQTPCAPHDADLTDKQTSRTQCGPLPQQHLQQTQCGPLPHQHVPQTPCAIPDADLTDMQTLRTQCGPLPQQHLPQTQCGPLPHLHMPHTPCAPHDADFVDTQTLRTQCGPLPQQHMPHTPCAPFDADLTDKQTLRTQCGQLPRQHMPQTPCAPLDADPTDKQTLRTQDGPLPQQHTPQTSCALDGSRDAPSLFDFEGVTVFDFDVDGHLTAERTQQAPCAASLSDFALAGLQDTLAQLLATTCGPSASWDARFGRLEAYAAATRQFELELGRTKDLPDSSSTSTTSRTQSGPMPQEHMSQPSCASPQFGPSPRQAASDRLTKVSRGQRKGKGKGKGKGKAGEAVRSSKPLT